MALPSNAPNPEAGPEFINAATVTIGQVIVSDNAANIQDSTNGVGIYTDYKIMSRYEKDRHIYMIPLATPLGFRGQSAAFAQLAAPTLLWICDWTAARWKVKPEVPNPASRDPNWVLLDDHWEPGQEVLGPDGTSVLYRISGCYIYGHKNPNAQTHRNINWTRPPWLVDVYDRSVPDSLLTRNLIDGRGGTGSPFQTFIPAT